MRRKVLIIEDELAIAELEKDYLELSDFEVTIETDGIKGRDMAMTGEYDMLILDVMLPGVDGYKICEMYRKKYLMPVIMVSAKGESYDKIHGLGFGADDYVTKPFDPSELVARVKNHMTRYENLTDAARFISANNEVIVTGEIEIDTRARKVFVRGKEKIFTAKEFDLLCYFVKNLDTVFSKAELYKEVWGCPEENIPDKVAIATVTVHIKKIRDKIEADCKQPRYIETLWGSGYRFNSL